LPKEPTHFYQQTLAAINSERANADAHRAQELRGVTTQLESQIRDLDEKISALSRENVACATEIKKYEDLVSGARAKCDTYTNNKKEQESMLKNELDKFIKQHYDLVNSTEKSQEAWINSKALTNEGMRRCAALSAELLWLPQQAVNDSNLYSVLSSNLLAFLDALVPLMSIIEDKLQQPSLQSATHEETLRWLQDNSITNPTLLDIVRAEGLTMSDLLGILQNLDDLPEMNNVPQYQRRRVKNLLEQEPTREQNAQADLRYNLAKIRSEIERVLVWKQVSENAAQQIINERFRVQGPSDAMLLTS